jgi:hypothetical protein
MTAMGSLRVGIAVDSTRVSGYVIDLLKSIVALGGVRLAVVMTPRPGFGASDVSGVDAAGPGPSGRHVGVSGAASALAASLLRAEATTVRLAGRLLGSVARRGGAIRSGRVDVTPWFEHAVQWGADDEATAPPLPEIDLVLVLGRWIPPRVGAALRAGDVVQLELVGEPAEGSPLAGFATAFAGLDRSSVRLNRISEDGRTRICLVDGMNRTRPLFVLNQAALWGRGISIVTSFVAQRRSGRAMPRTDVTVLPCADNGPPVTVARLLAYPLSVIARGIQAAAARARGGRHWSVAIVSTPPDAANAAATLQILEAPPGHWYADPVLCVRPDTGAVCCFVEEFDEAAGRAHIAVLERSAEGWVRLGVALKEPFHLSFPFVFEYDGVLYMCPETSEANEIVLYRCESFPLGWRRVATLMRGVSAADTMLFPSDGRWWMLTNIDRAPSPDHQSELHVFHADSPLSEDWQPIAGNPVKVDCHGARNAGLVSVGSTLYRIGQVQSFEMYGKALCVHRVVRIDQRGYEEDLVGRISPPEVAHAAGTHTYFSSSGMVAVDLVGPKLPPGVHAIDALPWRWVDHRARVPRRTGTLNVGERGMRVL